MFVTGRRQEHASLVSNPSSTGLRRVRPWSGEVRGDPARWEVLESVAALSEEDDLAIWPPCAWHPDFGHQAVCCNLISQLETLRDLLTHGTWCDGIEIAQDLTDHDAEMVFRYYGLAFLVVDQCVMDLRVICKTFSSTSVDRCFRGATASTMAAVNRIWKHHDKERNDGFVMHRDHHHGPYVFTDINATTPAEGLLVPSLTAGVTAVVKALITVDKHVTTTPSSLVALHAAYPPDTDAE